MGHGIRWTLRSRVAIAGVASALVMGAVAAPAAAEGGGRSGGEERVELDRGDGRDHGGNRGFACASDKTKDYAVDETKLPFDALPGTTTDRAWGVLRNAGYRIEVPEHWNGELVLWAHGFAGWACELTVDNSPIRAYLIEHGFAWGASSYAANGYAVQQGVDDTMRLARLFRHRYGKPTRTYLTGASMGGHITGLAIEQERRAFDGAMPVCGVMGDEELFDYFLDYSELAQAISGVTTSYPNGVDYLPAVVPAIKAALGGPTSPKYQTFAAAVMHDSGGTRPGFDIALGGWLDFLFGLGQPQPGVVPAFPATNIGTVYQLDGDPAVSAAEAALNASVRRVSRFDYPTPDGRVDVPEIEGTFRIPVLTLHTIGDLFVPFSMQQIYAGNAAEHGRSKLLVQRAIRDVGHCTFSEAELNEGFADLVNWVRNRVKPAGDDVLTAATVAAPTYGCRFSHDAGLYHGTPARALFSLCPAT